MRKQPSTGTPKATVAKSTKRSKRKPNSRTTAVTVDSPSHTSSTEVRGQGTHEDLAFKSIAILVSNKKSAEFDKQFRPKVAKWLTYWGARRNDIEDIVQEILRRGQKKIVDQQTVTPGCEEAYLKQMSRRLFMRFQNQARNNPLVNSAPIDKSTEPFAKTLAPDERALEGDLLTTIRAAIRSLPLRIRVATRLHLLDEFEYTEISEILEIPYNTAKQRVFVGRGKVQDYLSKRCIMLPVR